MSGDSGRPPWPLLVLGVVLVANPLFVPFADLSSPEYVYERATISADGERLEWNGTLRRPIDGIDCFEAPTRACGELEALVGRSVTVESPDRAGGPEDPFVALEDGWYRRVDSDADGGYELRLRPVSVETVFREISMSPSAVPERLRPAARGGRVTLDSRIEETYLVDDGGYYYLTRVRTDYPPFHPRFTDAFYRLLSGVGVLSGAIALVRAGRRRERFDRRRE